MASPPKQNSLKEVSCFKKSMCALSLSVTTTVSSLLFVNVTVRVLPFHKAAWSFNCANSCSQKNNSIKEVGEESRMYSLKGQVTLVLRRQGEETKEDMASMASCLCALTEQHLPSAVCNTHPIVLYQHF